MSSSQEALGVPGGTGVSTFLQKLLAMVEDHTCDHLISWSPEGTSFRVHDPVTFAKEVLPKYFKHNNFSSFVRQLNMYDFHKVIRDPPSGGARGPGGMYSSGPAIDASGKTVQEWEFANPKFRRGQLALLTQVKRKAGSTDTTKPKNESIKRVLSEVQAIQDQQIVVTEKLESLETDNRILWNEMSRLRDRHQLQQQTINRILYFLTSIYAPDRLYGADKKPLQGEDDTVTIDAGAAAYLTGPESEFAALGAGPSQFGSLAAPTHSSDLFTPGIGDLMGASPSRGTAGGGGMDMLVNNPGSQMDLGGRTRTGSMVGASISDLADADLGLTGYGNLVDPYQGLDMSGLGMLGNPLASQQSQPKRSPNTGLYDSNAPFTS